MALTKKGMGISTVETLESRRQRVVNRILENRSWSMNLNTIKEADYKRKSFRKLL
jgi:hypothetical protein